jgi:geranylgeranyl transferase type-2 subunit beta
VEFILACQDKEDGGISDRPGNTADVFHTFFGFCGLALLGYFESASVPFQHIDPTYALPAPLVKSLGLSCQTLPSSGESVRRSVHE